MTTRAPFPAPVCTASRAGPGRAGPGRATVRSVAKSLGPDLRLAVLAGDAVTVSRVEGRQSLGTGWVSYLLQETVAQLWEDPAVGRLLARAAAAYARWRRTLIDALAARGIAAGGRSGLAVWVPVADELAVTSALPGLGSGARRAIPDRGRAGDPDRYGNADRAGGSVAGSRPRRLPEPPPAPH